MSLTCPKCDASNITNLTDKKKEDLGLLFLNWLEKITIILIKALICSLPFSILFSINLTQNSKLSTISIIVEIMSILFQLIFTTTLALIILIKIISPIYKIFIGFQDISNIDKDNKQKQHKNLIIMISYYLCVGGIIFYAIPYLFIGIILKSQLSKIITDSFEINIDSAPFFNTAIPILIICTIGLLILYNIINIKLKNSFQCNNCGYIFDKKEIWKANINNLVKNKISKKEDNINNKLKKKKKTSISKNI